MTDTITIRGFASTNVELRNTQNGIPMGTFRMGSTERRLDRTTNQWVDGATNWFSVSMFRILAQNAASSIHRGDRIVLVGRLRVNNWAKEDGRTGTSVDIEAESVGPDLLFGTAHYLRNTAQRQDGANATNANDGGTNGHVGVTTGAPAPGHVPVGGPVGMGASAGAGVDANDEVDDDADDATDGATNDEEKVDRETGELMTEGAPF
ncbi:single-stranded DNA-binding protein [Specibacter cremeus]|uniref:single-stranded DNA-binding protein n=1 Tax=Specibacter cremeus TaxID=1629051 RepID=UPI0013DDEABF|nr:single-stranded DNA-binding protein [Specibacter cremeus]